MISPIVLNGVKKVLRAIQNEVPEWEYVPKGWEELQVNPKIRGWNVKEIQRIYQKKWPLFRYCLKGAKSLGVNHEDPRPHNDSLWTHNLVMSFAYVLALTRGNKKKISLLDWGGGIGHYYQFAKTLFPDLKMEYHCKDVPLLCETGKQIFPQAKFVSEENKLNKKYDLVFASSALHYCQDWRNTLAVLARLTGKYLFITRLLIVKTATSFVVIQRPYQHGYNSEYLCWVLNKGEFLRETRQKGLKLIREFVVQENPSVKAAPEPPEGRGFLFVRSKNKFSQHGKI